MHEPSIQDLERVFARDGFAQLLGIEIIELAKGYAKAACTIREDMLNFLGLPHGGAIFSLADAAFAAASNSHGQKSVALNVNISYLAAAQPGERLYAQAREEKLGKRTALYTIRVTNEENQPIAICQGLVYRRGQSVGGV